MSKKVQINEEMAHRLGYAGGITIPDVLIDYNEGYGTAYGLKEEVKSLIARSEKLSDEEKTNLVSKFEEIESSGIGKGLEVFRKIVEIGDITNARLFKKSDVITDIVAHDGVSNELLESLNAANRDKDKQFSFDDIKKELINRGVEFPINKKLLHLELLSLKQSMIKDYNVAMQWSTYAQLGIEALNLETHLSGENLQKMREMMDKGLEFMHESHEVLEDGIGTNLINLAKSTIVEQVELGVIGLPEASDKLEKVDRWDSLKRAGTPYFRDKANKLSLKGQARKVRSEIQSFMQEDVFKEYEEKAFVDTNFDRSFISTLDMLTSKDKLNHLNLVVQSTSDDIVNNPYINPSVILREEIIVGKLLKARDDMER